MEKAHSHSAQLIQKEEKNRKEKKNKPCTEFGENPVTLALLFLRLCTRTGVRMCGGAVRPYRRSALRAHLLLWKSPIFLSTPEVRALRSRVFKITPLPQPNQVTWVWLTSLHHFQVSPLLSRCFGYVRRLRTELPGHDGQTLWCEPEQVQSL